MYDSSLFKSRLSNTFSNEYTMCARMVACQLNDHLGVSGISECHSYLPGTQTLAVALWMCPSRTEGILHGRPGQMISTLARTTESEHRQQAQNARYSWLVFLTYNMECFLHFITTFTKLLCLIFQCEKYTLYKYNYYYYYSRLLFNKPTFFCVHCMLVSVPKTE